MGSFVKRIRSFCQQRRSVSIDTQLPCKSEDKDCSCYQTGVFPARFADPPPKYTSILEPVIRSYPKPASTQPPPQSKKNKQTFRNEHELLRSQVKPKVPGRNLIEIIPWYHLPSEKKDNENIMSLVEEPCGCRVPRAYQGESISSSLATAATRSRLGELDEIYPERKRDYRQFSQDDKYQFTIRRDHRDSTFEFHEENFGKCKIHANNNSVLSSPGGVERLNVHGRDFRLFERLARGSAVVITTSFVEFFVHGYSYDEWAQDEKTKALIFPCFETLRDAAECMVEILQAAISGYDKGHPGCLWALINQDGIFSNNDPSFRESLSLLHEWTSKKHPSHTNEDAPQEAEPSPMNLSELSDHMRTYLHVL